MPEKRNQPFSTPPRQVKRRKVVTPPGSPEQEYSPMEMGTGTGAGESKPSPARFFSPPPAPIKLVDADGNETSPYKTPGTTDSLDGAMAEMGLSTPPSASNVSVLFAPMAPRRSRNPLGDGGESKQAQQGFAAQIKFSQLT